MLGIPLKMIPAYVSIGAALLAVHMNFSVVFMEGGSGKNGATIAVSVDSYLLMYF